MDKRWFRLILYLMPAIMDCITGIFFFIGPVRAVLLGYDPLVAGSVVASRSIACCLCSFIVSRYLNSKNAVAFMFISNIGLFFACLLGLGATNLTMLYITSAFSGAMLVAFCTGFQVFIKVVDRGESRTLSRVVGSYTVSWCVGMSFGPSITGFLMALGRPADGVGLSIGWIYAYLAAAFLSVVMFIGFLWVRSATREFMRQHRERKREPGINLSEGSGWQDLAWLGWTTAILGVCVVGVVRGVFPAGVTQLGMPEWRSGLMMMLFSASMGIFAYIVSLGHRWMYSGGTMLSLAGMGVAGLVFYYLPWFTGWDVTETYWQFYIASVVFGGYSGTFYLFSGFHALAHPDKDGRNISLNETFISVGMMVGPVLGGWVAKHHGFYIPFMFATFLLVVVAGLQFVVLRRAKRVRKRVSARLGREVLRDGEAG